MKTQLKNSTRPYWSWKSASGSPFRSRVTWADGHVLQCIPSVFLYSLAYATFRHAERYTFVVNPKPWWSLPLPFRMISKTVYAHVCRHAHTWERSGKVEGPPKYPAEQCLEASCRVSSDSFVTWSPVILTVQPELSFSTSREGQCHWVGLLLLFLFSRTLFLLSLHSSYASSDNLIHCPSVWPHVTVHPVIFKSKVWMCLGHKHYFWPLIASMDVFIMNSLLPWSYFTGIKLTARDYLFMFQQNF